MWKEDPRLSIDMFGDENNFMLLTITDRITGKVDTFPVEQATPELLGVKFAKYLKEKYWHDEQKTSYRKIWKRNIFYSIKVEESIINITDISYHFELSESLDDICKIIDTIRYDSENETLVDKYLGIIQPEITECNVINYNGRKNGNICMITFQPLDIYDFYEGLDKLYIINHKGEKVYLSFSFTKAYQVFEELSSKTESAISLESYIIQ